MNRFSLTFLVLTAAGGCMALSGDPTDIDDPPRRPNAQAWSPNTASSWRGSDGRPVQTAAADWNARPYTTNSAMISGSTYVSPRTTASKDTTSTTATASAKSSTKSKAKSDAVVQTTYTDGKASDSDSTLSATAGPKSTTAKKTTESSEKVAEAKSPPVNLGVLRLLNSKRISFHYEVKDSASAGVAGLELWGTSDMKSWKKYDIVTRTPSSLAVEVKEEGLYGFTMIARGKSESAKNQPPQAGEPPQVWVAVDLTKPVVQLLGAELNVMAQTPALVIRWSAKDRNLGPRPISLLYAEKLEGPWSAVSASIENSGRYEWTMPPCVPSNVYVRVQATDMMGNVGMAQTATLHIPGRSSAVATTTSIPTLAEPPRLSSVPLPLETNLRPIAATVTNPAVSILSVDGE